MKSVHLLVVVVSGMCLLCGQVCAKEVTLDDGAVSFTVPEDFTQMTAEEISIKWPTKLAPKFAIGSERRSTTIAYEHKEQPLLPSQLEEARAAITPVVASMIPSIDWKQNAVVEIGGRSWILFEATSAARDTDVYNIVMLTSHKGRVLMFNFNSTKADFAKMEKVLRESIQSIKVKD